MGIRFRCHQCGHDLHVKDFQGGKRSKCPECETKFRIPAESAEYSIPLDNSQRDPAATAESSQGTSGGTATGTIAAKSTLAKSNTRPTEREPIEREPSAQDIESQNDAPQEIDSVVEPATASSLQPLAILEAPGATWYVRPPAGGQYGPAPADIFCEWLTENRVTRDSLVWRDGWPQWLVASDVFTDYFGPALPPTIAPTFAAAPAIGAPSPPLASPAEQTTASEFALPTSLSDRALAARKRQRKKNYVIMIGILAAISIGLVIALVVVLMRSA